MNRSMLLALPLLLASWSQSAQAQVSPAWDEYRKSQASGEAQAAPAPVTAPPLGEGDYYRPASSARQNGGGFFIGAQAGQGWIYEDVDQDVLSFNGGYRWQAGSIALLGIELAAGRFDSTRYQNVPVPKAEFQSIGFTGRFNFGVNNPVYGLVRAGYWTAEAKAGEYSDEADGGYAGIGLGVDIGRHFNVNLVYSNYVYATEYYWEDEFTLSRADMVTFGVEARF